MRRFFALFSLLVVGAVGLRGQSPYESSADFAKYAMKLREQALLKVEPQVFVPTTSRTSMTRFPWKTNIVTTVFWIGEAAGGNNPVPNVKSSWDANWTSNYGGFDSPDAGSRRNYIPVSFVPRQNPFYCRAALQRCHARAVQAGSRPGDSVVQAGLHRARPFGLQGPLACDPQGQSHLLCAMGRLRAFSHRSFSIRLPERAAEAEPEPRRRSGCFAGGAGLPWAFRPRT